MTSADGRFAPAPSRPRRKRARGRPGERGIILIAVVIIAILYFALIELMLMESTEASRQAERFRARVTAHVLAENAAELAAENMVNAIWTLRTYTDDQGTVRGEYKRSNDSFEITGGATTSGVAPTKADVKLQGIVDASKVTITFSTHSQ
jgi:type II secretory pathway pseudopilin PulG